MFGGVSSIHDFAAECVTPTEVCSFSRAGFDALLKIDVELDRQILKSVSSELIETRVHSLILARESVKARVLAFLQVMRIREYRRTGNSDFVDLFMTRQEIADYLGLALETVSRALHQLEKDGAIRLENIYRVWIEEIDSLADITRAV